MTGRGNEKKNETETGSRSKQWDIFNVQLTPPSPMTALQIVFNWSLRFFTSPRLRHNCILFLFLPYQWQESVQQLPLICRRHQHWHVSPGIPLFFPSFLHEQHFSSLFCVILVSCYLFFLILYFPCRVTSFVPSNWYWFEREMKHAFTSFPLTSLSTAHRKNVWGSFSNLIPGLGFTKKSI